SARRARAAEGSTTKGAAAPSPKAPEGRDAGRREEGTPTGKPEPEKRARARGDTGGRESTGGGETGSRAAGDGS
ncbi:hypothetical protein C3R26_21105, partial [Mycobacterium tuberculosis]